MVSREDGGIWRDHDFPTGASGIGGQREAVGLPDLRPFDLRRSFASLMPAEGTNLLEVAGMMRHCRQVLFSTYAPVIAELGGEQLVRAEDRIAEARARVPLAA